MIAVAIIAFRESLEILLIGGALYSALIEHKIQKKREVFMGAFAAVLLSFFLFIIVAFVGPHIHFVVDQTVGEILEGINFVGTGIFLFLTAVILHNRMKNISSYSSTFLLNSSLFAIGFLSVFREGIEIVFFSIPPSLSSSFVASVVGLIGGISFALLVGRISIRFADLFIQRRILFRISNWVIALFSLYLVVRGLLIVSKFIF